MKPNEGDKVGSCCHIGKALYYNFAYNNVPVEIKLPDGRKEKISWVVVCNACKNKIPNCVSIIGVWEDDELVIESLQE